MIPSSPLRKQHLIGTRCQFGGQALLTVLSFQLIKQFVDNITRLHKRWRRRETFIQRFQKKFIHQSYVKLPWYHFIMHHINRYGAPPRMTFPTFLERRAI
jgi:hypothetical protein